jgi:hypothetical protein
MSVSPRAKSLIELIRLTRKSLDLFREELKMTKRWSAAHQEAYNAWKRHLEDSEKHAREASGKTPKAAWDLAVAQARDEREQWGRALRAAREKRGKPIGLDVFEQPGS